MKAIVTVLVPVVALAAACATAPTSSAPQHWRAPNTSANQFPSDNLACATRTSRLANLTTPAPENRLDRPMQKWPNATAQDIYEGCMLERGWRPAG
jgi:hypothetical protein